MTLRFRRRKSLAGRRAHSLVNEPLEAPTVEVFADVDVSSAVDREGMRYVQRPAEDPLLSDVIDDLECLTQKNPDVVVSAVDHVQEAVIRRKREPRGRPGGPSPTRLWRSEGFAERRFPSCPSLTMLSAALPLPAAGIVAAASPAVLALMKSRLFIGPLFVFVGTSNG
jgi:hypothetical protein